MTKMETTIQTVLLGETGGRVCIFNFSVISDNLLLKVFSSSCKSSSNCFLSLQDHSTTNADLNLKDDVLRMIS